MGGIKNKLNKLSNKAKTLFSNLASPTRLGSSASGTASRRTPASRVFDDTGLRSKPVGLSNQWSLYASKTIGSLRLDDQSLLLGKGRQMSVAHRWGRYTKYLAISCLSLALISTIGLNLYRAYSSNGIRTNAAVGEGQSDTGVASLDRVDIVQAGTGQSVTIDGTTMDETVYGTDTTRRTILNNNVVRYNAVLDVATPGTITVSMTLPANNTIDESSVSTAAGCLTGSLSKQTVDGKGSYTNNKATCTLNPTDAGQTNWQVTAYLWGGNNEAIQPTMFIAGQDQSIRPDSITVVGKGNYGVDAIANAVGQNSSSGGIVQINFSLALYSKGIGNNSLGVAPIENGRWSVNIDMSSMPEGWEVVDKFMQIMESSGVYIGASGGLDSQAVHSGYISDIVNEGERLNVSISDGVTGARHCPTTSTVGGSIEYVDKCYYSGVVVRMNVPADKLTADPTNYPAYIGPIDLQIAGSGTASVEPSPNQIAWSLSNRGSGSTESWPYSVPPGSLGAWESNRPIYSGQSLRMREIVSSSTPLNDGLTNFYSCMTWNPLDWSITGEFARTGSIIPLDATYSTQYGVIGTDMSISPSSSRQHCGRYGDANIENEQMFFGTLEEANAYAKEHSLKVNAMRLWVSRMSTGFREQSIGHAVFRVNGADGALSEAEFNVSSVSDQWDVTDLAGEVSSDTPIVWYGRLVPGLLAHTITAEPSSTSPNTEDHITITPRTYNMDTDTKITVTLPSGLTPKDNSFYVSDYRLVEGSDYTVTPRDNGGYTIVFDTDQIAVHSGLPITGEPAIMPGESGNDTGLPIAMDNNGNGIVRDSIEFDVLVDNNTPTPSTLTIASTTSGTGTNSAVSTFRTARADIAVATQKTFGYSLSSSASSIYVGDNLIYTLSNTNTLDDSTTNLTSINVLPYDGDSRGTTGLGGYRVDDLVVSDNLGDNPALYYTTDQAVRELERTDPLALDGRSSDEANNNLASSINWVECSLGDAGECTNLPANVTAFKYAKPTMASGETVSLVYTLTDIQISSPNEAESQTINNSLNYTMVEAISNPVTDTSTTTTAYLGSLLLLSLDKDALEVEIEPNVVQTGNGNATSPDSLTNVLSLVAKTASGYNLTMRLASEDAGLVNVTSDTNQTYVIPTIDTQPTAGRAGWSVTLDGVSWHSLPTINGTPLTVASSAVGGSANKTIPVTYGIATTNSTVAGTYTNKVTYTVTAAI